MPRPEPSVAYERLVRRFAQRIPENEAAAREVRRRLPAAVQLLVERFGARKVVVFGSLPRGLFDHERSDVDLAVEGLGISELAEARDALAVILERRVDVIGIEDATPELSSQIDRGEVLFGSR